MKRLAASLFSRFRTSERGAILVETLLVIPVITIFAIGVLEFGYVFWERQQMQAGVRDAARYWSRCSLSSFNASRCTVAKAREIAVNYYDPVSDAAFLRINGWDGSVAAAVTVTPSTPPANPATTDIVTVTGTLMHRSSPLFRLLNLNPIPITYTYSTRYIGW